MSNSPPIDIHTIKQRAKRATNWTPEKCHHETAQVGFWVAWAAMFLLGLITSPFRATTKSKD